MEEPGKKAWALEKVVTRRVKASYKIHLKLSSKKSVRNKFNNLPSRGLSQKVLSKESALNLVTIFRHTIEL